MKLVKLLQIILIVVLFLGIALQSTFARNLHAIDKCYLSPPEDLAVDLILKSCNVPDLLNVSITCPPPVTVTCTNQVPPANFAFGMATSTCPGTVSVVHLGDVISNQICPNIYTITRTYEATDACLNTATCSQVITVLDNIAPVLTCPPSITVSCASQVPPPNNGTVLVIDCGTSTTVCLGDVISNQICPSQYLITRTYQVYDVCGNSASCAQLITVFDNTPASITCPPNITISCTDATAPSSTGMATSIDNCNQNAAMTFSDNYIPGSCPYSGTIQRTFMAVDNCGNSSTCMQIISIVDNIPPVISNGPVDITVTASGPSPCSMYVSIGIPTATDNCDPSVLVSNDFNFTANASGVYSEGSTLVTYTATDDCGNTSTHSFMVLVICQPPVPCGIVVHNDCNVEISGYTRLGGVSEGAPYIKMKELPSTTTGSNNNSTISIPHGLVASKIISVSVLVESTTDNFIPPEYSTAINLRYSFSVSPTDIVIQNNTLPGDCVICSKPAKVLIIYKQ